MFWRPASAFIRPAFLFCTALTILPGNTPAYPQTALPVEQIVDRMQQHEASQSKELKHYEAVRHYQVEYKGFGTHLAAKMDVDLNYDSVSGKRFQILSQSGSKLLCDKVLKRAVESEEEASKDKASTALNGTNYRFQLVGTEPVDGRKTYILHVDPLKMSKFFYRGKVWVDGNDYAVIKIEVEPAQNPSLWITRTQIENTNLKTDGVWLPGKNRSESKIRIGGTAVLTIDYGTYQVTLAGPQQTAANGSATNAVTTNGAAF
jgi:outer membrane lipoprotein-sorting protein